MRNIRVINFRENKILVLSVIFSILLVLYIAIPTLSEYKNTNALNTITVWDGSVALMYDGEGTIESPYVINSGSELALLAVQLETNDFQDKYFVLGNDIVLNKGIFNYKKDEGIKYIEEGVTNVITPNVENNIVNVFKSLNGFKGNFSGNGHFIYGLYIDESRDGQNGLFTNLEGNVSDLYVKNSLIYGGKVVAGVASKTNNSILTNVTYNGYVVSDNDIESQIINVTIEDVIGNTLDFEKENYINISNLEYIPGVVTKIVLSGNYKVVDDSNNVIDDLSSNLKISGKEVNLGEFKLELGNELLTNIQIEYQSDIDSNFSLTNLSYEISYCYNNAAGIVSIAENTQFINVVNRASVYGNVYSSGIVNLVTGNILLNNVYNAGYVESNGLSSGLISNINLNSDNVDINNSYNAGELVSDNSAMIGDILNNAGYINLINVFNAHDSFGINLIESSNVIVDNSYVVNDTDINVGTSVGGFDKTSLENLKNKEFVQSYLKYDEYVNSESDNVWVWQYDGNSLPILYIDELNEAAANIHIKDHMWNSFNSNLDIYNFSSEFVFSIEKANELNTIKDIYYYISSEKESLDRNDLDMITDWQKYDGIININDEGFYTIYAKIVDYNDDVIYINTDLLILDMTGSNIIISSSLSDDIWDTFKTNVSNYYIDKEMSVNITAEDLLSGIDKIYYYVSDSSLSQEELDNIDNWSEYTDSIVVNSNRTIVYVKVVDNCNHVTYVNTDLIILDGYILNKIAAGMNDINSDNIYINEKSSVSFSFSYKDINEYSDGSKHQIISNVLLPKGTKITIIDKANNKVYSYTTEDLDYGYNDCIDAKCVAKYDFELFNEVGSKVKFDEGNYTGTIDENFVIVVDFADTNIDENIENISISMKLNNSNQNEIRNTLTSSIKTFNIISNDSNAFFTLNSDFNDTINYNSDTIYTISFNTKMNYKLLGDNKIFDTSFDGKKLGLLIKMVNDKGIIVDRHYLKNISFKIGDKKYSPSSDGIVRIDLDNGINDTSGDLVIQTYADNSKLETGNYKFIIGLYSAYDGMYSYEYLSNIEIPVYVGDNIYNNTDGFNVIMNDEDKIVSSKMNEFNFEILLSDKYEFDDVRVSLYKRNSLKVYDQKYNIINLGEYMSDSSLELYKENIYYVSNFINDSGILNINLNASLLEKNGYMFVFELYENDKIVNKISKKFIIK